MQIHSSSNSNLAVAFEQELARDRREEEREWFVSSEQFEASDGREASDMAQLDCQDDAR